jgi:hypothetical protein
MIHVTDADSSRAVVIEEVRLGRSLVVQGTSGTGKSQTITNIIATAVKEGRRSYSLPRKWRPWRSSMVAWIAWV